MSLSHKKRMYAMAFAFDDDSSDESDESSSDEEDFDDFLMVAHLAIQAKREQRMKEVVIVMGMIFFFISRVLMDNVTIPRMRAPNVHRDRHAALEFVRSWDDTMFHRQFRLVREDFNYVLQKIYSLIEKDEEMARRSSGSSVSPELKLYICLRILAGASYLDMIWYQVHVDQVRHYIRPVLEAIHAVINNINLPYTLESFNQLASNWASVQDRKHGFNPTPGMIGATDGLVIQRQKPTAKELEGSDYRRWLNRKGYFAWVAQAIVGAYTEFLMFELRWPGATNDSVAFGMSEGRTWLDVMSDIFPNGWLAGDDAYSALHEQLVTPFTKSQLKKNRTANPELYKKMRAFNQVLSSQRITVERAFGILVRRFGCFWSTFEGDAYTSQLMIIVCAKLHNICVARWKQQHPDMPVPDVPEHMDVSSEYDLSDEEVRLRLNSMHRSNHP
jgi:nuclease HARBI1